MFNWAHLVAVGMMVLGSEVSAAAARQLKVDHVTICGPDLTALQSAFARLGLTPDYGGPHATGGTHMAVLGLQDGSYVELVAPLKAGAATDSGWSKLMLANAGPCAWAVGSDNIQNDVDAMKRAGLSIEGPLTGGRKKPDGKVLEWQTAALATEHPGAVLPFMIQDRTPREWRVLPSTSAKNMGLGGVAAVVLGVRDLDAAIATFRETYSWSAPLREDHAEFGAKLAHFEGTPVILATPLGSDCWLAKRLSELGESPVAFLLSGPDFQKASANAKPAESKWFGRTIAWFDADQREGARLGVLE